MDERIDDAFRPLTDRYSRGTVWAGIVGVVIFSCLCGALLSLRWQNARAREEAARVITVDQSMKEGCCLVIVHVQDLYRSGNGGTYQVETVSGRRPSTTEGKYYSGSNVQVFVGKDWVGRILLKPSNCPRLVKATEMVGGPLGWNHREQTVTVYCL